MGLIALRRAQKEVSDVVEKRLAADSALTMAISKLAEVAESDQLPKMIVIGKTNQQKMQRSIFMRWYLELVGAESEPFLLSEGRFSGRIR